MYIYNKRFAAATRQRKSEEKKIGFDQKKELAIRIGGRFTFTLMLNCSSGYPKIQR